MKEKHSFYNENLLSMIRDSNPIVDCFALDGDLFCNRKNENFFIKNAILIGPTAYCTMTLNDKSLQTRKFIALFQIKCIIS